MCGAPPAAAKEMSRPSGEIFIVPYEKWADGAWRDEQAGVRGVNFLGDWIGWKKASVWPDQQSQTKCMVKCSKSLKIGSKMINQHYKNY